MEVEEIGDLTVEKTKVLEYILENPEQLDNRDRKWVEKNKMDLHTVCYMTLPIISDVYKDRGIHWAESYCKWINKKRKRRKVNRLLVKYQKQLQKP